MAEINGTPGPDTINGTAGDDTINAGDGNDILTGGDGDDIINGDGGDDTITSLWLDGFDTLNGGAGNDILSTDDGTDTLNGGDGNDTITFLHRNNAPQGGIANGGAGDDLIRLNARNITSIDGGSGIDTLEFGFPNLAANSNLGRNFDLTALWSGGAGTINGSGTITGIELLAPTVWGTNFDDIMVIGAGYLQALTIYGGSGNDQITGGGGNDRIETGPGSSNVQGGLGNDSILGGNGIDVLSGQDGDDFIFGAEDADSLDGGAGNDALEGGVGADVLTGGSGDDTLNGVGFTVNPTGDGIADTLIGGIGNDVYFVNVSGDVVTELAGEGDDEVRTNLAAYVLGANVERLTYTGGGAFAGIGNALDNVITGALGRDELFGNDGNDALYDVGADPGQGDYLAGGAGNDRYYISNRETSTAEAVNAGIDTVFTDFSIYGLQANIENLTTTGNATHAALVGNILDNVITGGTGTDDLFGREGNDTLVGGSGAANTLLGQEGDDSYVVAAAGDSVVEFANEGLDTVQASVASFTLGANVENLTFTGGATARIGVGNSLGNTMIGLGGADSLNGLGGSDVILGGSGADVLQGGIGTDTDYFLYQGGEVGVDRILDFASTVDKIALRFDYFTPTATVDFVSGIGAVATTANSTIIFHTNSGIVYYDDDGIGAGAPVALAALNVDQIFAANDVMFYHNVPAGVAGAPRPAIFVGTADNDTLTGYSGNDTLDGGAGTDIAIGGPGDDLYIVRQLSDIVIENAGEGIDEVQSVAVNYELPPNVENLSFAGFFSTIFTTSNARYGTGNALDNRITGGPGNDTLLGGEGNDTIDDGPYIGLLGATDVDTLLGGPGDDVYFVSYSQDSVVEYAGEGTDTVYAYGNYALGANLENLTLIGENPHFPFRSGQGNDLANIIRGVNGRDSLVGLGGDDILYGGSGADDLNGGSGADQFRYEGGETGIDRIVDFLSGTDKIALRSAFFTPTATVAFVSGVGAVANTANSTILYDPSTGIVSYDDDGNGAGAAVQLAQLNGGQTFVAGDFIFY